LLTENKNEPYYNNLNPTNKLWHNKNPILLEKLNISKKSYIIQESENSQSEDQSLQIENCGKSENSLLKTKNLNTTKYIPCHDNVTNPKELATEKNNHFSTQKTPPVNSFLSWF
jgi:hypothetical protein